jgi:hypothetical protein
MYYLLDPFRTLTSLATDEAAALRDDIHQVQEWLQAMWRV